MLLSNSALFFMNTTRAQYKGLAYPGYFNGVIFVRSTASYVFHRERFNGVRKKYFRSSYMENGIGGT